MGKPGLVDAAPAAVFRKRRLGGPWVAVRAHYGRCLQWLDGTGEGWAKACLDGELARACARKLGPSDRNRCDGASERRFCYYQGASIGAPSRLEEGEIN